MKRKRRNAVCVPAIHSVRSWVVKTRTLIPGLPLVPPLYTSSLVPVTTKTPEIGNLDSCCPVTFTTVNRFYE